MDFDWTHRLDVVFNLMIAVCVLLALTTVLFAAAPGFLGRELVVVGSGSMAPTFEEGDALLVAPPSGLGAGDTVIFATEQQGRLKAHRIVEVVLLEAGVYLRTQGDANPAPDPDLVPLAAVHGRVDFALPLLGRLLTLLTETPVGLVVFAMPVLTLALQELRDVIEAEG